MLHRTECVFPSACPPQAPKFFGSGLVCRIRKLREMTEACRRYRIERFRNLPSRGFQPARAPRPVPDPERGRCAFVLCERARRRRRKFLSAEARRWALSAESHGEQRAGAVRVANTSCLACRTGAKCRIRRASLALRRPGLEASRPAW